MPLYIASIEMFELSLRIKPRKRLVREKPDLWSNLVYGHQEVLLSDCSITRS